VIERDKEQKVIKEIPIHIIFNSWLALKLKFDFSDKGMAAFNVGDEEPAIILKEKNKFPDAKPTIWFIVDNVNDEYKRLCNNGGNFISKPFQIGTVTRLNLKIYSAIDWE
jgi:predicted enzyme related to lactoylglutathione lyase